MNVWPVSGASTGICQEEADSARLIVLGRWRYGFFSMVPVGATNVGSIKINFDQVNTLTHDTGVTR